MKVVTRSINEYSLSPKEYDVYDGLVKHYEFVADEYPDAWKFKQFLKNLNYCDFSDIQDDIYFIINVVKPVFERADLFEHFLAVFFFFCCFELGTVSTFKKLHSDRSA